MDAHARLLVGIIDALRRDGVTVVLTTHQLKEPKSWPIDWSHRPRMTVASVRRGADARRRQDQCGSPRRPITCRYWLPPAGNTASDDPEYLVEGPVDRVLATVTRVRTDQCGLTCGRATSLEDVFSI